MKKEIYSIPGKVVGHHDPVLKAIIDTWTSLFITLEQWKSTVYDIGITDYAPKNGVVAWIIDTSKARSSFPPDVQEFREKVAKAKLEDNGVKYLFVVVPEKGFGRLSAGRTADLYNDIQGGLQSFEVQTLDEAKAMLRKLMKT